MKMRMGLEGLHRFSVEHGSKFKVCTPAFPFYTALGYLSEHFSLKKKMKQYKTVLPPVDSKPR